MIKKIFFHQNLIDPIIQESNNFNFNFLLNLIKVISPSEANLNAIKLNNYTLKILEPNLENKYNFERKKGSIKFLRFYFLCIFAIFCLYAIVDSFYNFDEVSIFIKLSVLFISIFFLIYLFSTYFTKTFYHSVLIIILFMVLMKIIFDWSISKMSISFAAALVASISTVNVNNKILFIIVLNIIHLIQFILRYINLNLLS